MDVMATPGPATDQPEDLKALVEAGARWFRIKMTHDPVETIQRRLEALQSLSSPEQPLHLWMDISGDRPRIHTDQDTLHLQATQNVYLLLQDPPQPTPHSDDNPEAPPQPTPNNDVDSSEDDLVLSEKRARIHIRMDPKLFAHVQTGHRMTTADGRVCLNVERVLAPHALLARTQYAISPVRRNKGINFPDTPLYFDPLGEQDRTKLSALDPHLFTGCIVSFVRSAQCLQRAKDELRALYNTPIDHLQIIAKLETPDVVPNLDSILDHCDGVLIGRGDLAFEAGWIGMVRTQDAILRACRSRNVWCCVGTGVLSSMIRNTIPTRSEVSDLARILDHGADAVMFAGETARGKHPHEAVRFAKTFAHDYAK